MTETSNTISNEAFARLAAPRLAALLGAAKFMAGDCERQHAAVCLTRPLLGRILSECAILEEFFDSFGAHRNSRFYLLRELVAAGNVFAAAAYKLLHVSHSLSRYNLYPVKGKFAEDTHHALDSLSRILGCTMGLFSEQVAELKIAGIPLLAKEDYTEFQETGTLVGDREVQEHYTEGTILALCTELLGLAASAEAMRLGQSKTPAEWRKMIPKWVNEEKVRNLVEEFNRFKALYDTGLSFSTLEKLDPDLPALRSHVSVVSHLSEAAAQLVHFYERHLDIFENDDVLRRRSFVDRESLLEIIFGYLARYARWYSAIARELSQKILAKYSETGSLSLAIPQYRGFHVRPSTLIAKIARHYGGNLRMNLLNESYDATQPLELFRANESVNAIKRMRLAEKLEALDLPDAVDSPDGSIEMVRGAVLKLAEKQQLVIYEQPLPLDANHTAAGRNVLAFAVEKVKKLLAMGKIDLDFPVEATFTGDTRILKDLAKLAACGYGEDRQGHNIPLPDQLAYLRKSPYIA